MHQPKWTRPRANRHINEDIWVNLTERPGNVEEGHKVWTHAIPRAVPLKGIHTRGTHQLCTALQKPLLVTGMREVERAIRGDNPHLARKVRALTVAPVPAQR